jgi:two-component system, cell cycle sensor histidine kinase and response regulator CckA
MASEKKKILASSDQLVKGEGLVLVVDDEPIIRKIATNILVNSGYDVIDAEDGPQALERLKEHGEKICLVLLDLLLPGLSGKEIYLQMKQIQPEIKVVLVSGTKKDSRISELLEMGVLRYVEKPYTFAYLSHVVHDAIYSV